MPKPKPEQGAKTTSSTHYPLPSTKKAPRDKTKPTPCRTGSKSEKHPSVKVRQKKNMNHEASKTA